MATDYAKRCDVNSLTSEYVQSYFAQLNPMAERIAKAISDTKAAYGALWYTLNASDQNEIINETLIKPEITLQYIDNLAGKRSFSSSSLEFSSPGSLGTKKKNFDNKKSSQYYGFDERSLSSYAAQRVAQKLLKDDALADAGYRDEHSAPFNYRTRSQINFHLFNKEELSSAKETKDVVALPYNKSKMITEASNIAKAAVRKQQELIKKPKQAPPPIPVAKAGLVKSEQKLTKTATTEMPDYANYVSQQQDDENSSLIPTTQMRKDSKTFISSSQLSNTTASDEDEYYQDDIQNQMEEVKLLDTSNLKRGFEFLSNW